jgi:hypothetical protein
MPSSQPDTQASRGCFSGREQTKRRKPQIEATRFNVSPRPAEPADVVIAEDCLLKDGRDHANGG